MKDNQFEQIYLTSAQRKWLEKHFKHTKNAEIAERFNISYRSVVRIAKRMGLKKSPQFMKKTQLEAAAKAKESNLKNGTYNPKGFKIPRSEEFHFKKGVSSLERLGEKREKERIAKSMETRRQLFKLERARVLFGLPQQTKLRVSCKPPIMRSRRYYLRQRGYIIERGSNVVYYNSETRRSLSMEQRPRTGFTFKPMEA